MERSLPFYRALLAHLGPTDEGSIVGEHGEVVVYLNLPGGALGVREADSAGAVDRYAPGLHHAGLYAVFFFDPNGLKLEVVHQPPRDATPA